MKRTAWSIGRRLLNHQVVRFLVVGVVNTIFGYLVFLVGLAAGLVPGAALLVATVVGALWNYGTTARFVFAQRGFGRLPAFAAAYGIVYVMNLLAIRLLIHSGFLPALAQAVLLLPAAALSFVLFRSFVFRAPDSA